MKTKRAWAQQDPSEGIWCCQWPGTHSPELHPDSKCHRRALTPRVSSHPSWPPISMTAFPSPCPPTLPPSPCAHLGSQQPRLILQQRLKLTHGPTQVNPPTPVQGSTVGGSQRGSEPPPPPPPPPATPLTQQGYCRHHVAKVGAVLWGRYRLGSQPSPLTLSSLGRVGSPQVFPNLWVSRRSGTLPSPLSPLTCEPRRVPCTP